MRILIVHCYYQLRGGEDFVVDEEHQLLSSRGEDVSLMTLHNESIVRLRRTKLVRQTLWNQDFSDELNSRVRADRIDVVHFHNTFPLISPAAYRGAREAGAAVVQTLHNYRLLCPSGLMLRDGHVCQSCIGHSFPWPAIVHACNRNSRSISAVTATMLSLHRLLGTFVDNVDQYVALTEFGRTTFVNAGMPESKITVKPNFVDSDALYVEAPGDYVLYVGRLSHEKGVRTLLDAWSRLSQRIPLRIIGDGPLRTEVEAACRMSSQITWQGQLPKREVLAAMAGARFLVVPSLWYEAFGRIIIEAYSRGTPVLASNLGAMAELVDVGSTGFLFRAGDVGDLAHRIVHFWSEAGSDRMMRRHARRLYESKFTAQQNYERLMQIYQLALAQRARA